MPPGPHDGAAGSARSETSFDDYVAIDWSARSVPARGADSVWIAWSTGGGRNRPKVVNPATRAEAMNALTERLLRAVAAGRRVLVTIDANLGYPGGLAAALGEWPGTTGGAAPWRLVWDAIAAEVDDRADNSNNRFAAAARLNRGLGPAPGPFWGRPATLRLRPDDLAALTTRKTPSYPYRLGRGAGLGEWRATEVAARRGRVRPKSAWQLLGAGSVGGQTLLALPALRGLRDHPQLSCVTRVWPFETGLVPPVGPGPTVWIAEAWPTLVTPPTPPGVVRDEAQVRALAGWLARRDGQGALRTDLTPTLPDALGRLVVAEEGWILGVPGPRP